MSKIRPNHDFITRFFLSIGGKGISLSDRCVWGGGSGNSVEFGQWFPDLDFMDQ